MAIEFKNISKQFGSFFANKNISFKIETGQIHALIGENGAGKSTLCKILFGIYQPDAGQIFINGKPVKITSPMVAKKLKIGMVHQHFYLADPISALDHVILDQNQIQSQNQNQIQNPEFKNQSHPFLFDFIKNNFSFISRDSIQKNLEQISKNYGMPIPWQTAVGQLPVGIQQRLEILKLLYNKADILILDEPTAVLTPQEVDSFFDQIKKLKASGKTIIIITHKLKEVMALSDTITVFRQGQHIKTLKTADTNTTELAELMVGKSWSPTEAVRERQAAGTTLLSFRNYSLAPEYSATQSNLSIANSENTTATMGPGPGFWGLIKYIFKSGFSSHRPDNFKSITEKNQTKTKKVLDNINFNMRPNEIVGVAGIEGNGQNEFVESIVNPLKFKGRRWGQIELRDHSLLQMTSQQIKMLGISYLPPDRMTEGLLLESDSYENFILGYHRTDEFQSKGWINFPAIFNRVKTAFENFDIRPQNPLLPLKNFSGGNQQKLIIAREIMETPDLLIACQPTRGVDIGAIDRIHQEFFRLKKVGSSVLVVSSDLDELLRICDRIVVMYNGKIVGQYFYYEFDEKKIGSLMGGATV